MPVSDEELLALVIKAQQELPYKTASYEKLARIGYAKVRALAKAITGDFDTANLISQEVFIRVFHNLHRLNDPSKYLSWRRKITINVTNTILTKEKREAKKRRRYGKEPNIDQIGVGTTDSYATMLEELNVEERTIVSLKVLSGFEFSEIADIVELSVSAAKMRYYRALEKIKMDLEE
ncbi:MAG: RNA polymerase sigma-70 factor (ECF subfamily) [Candidatus Azotimanducaceae bacterium]|jgi:RNA polymerase sigma-70 factor (ECF subfamily)